MHDEHRPAPGISARTSAPSLVLAQFGVLATVWGASFLFIKVGLRGLSPTQVSSARVWFGALTLVAISAVRRRPLPRQSVAYAHLFVVGLLLCVLPFTLFAYGETRISSGLASIINATTPLLTMVVASVFLPAERPTAARLVGLGLGFAGVLVVFAPWRGVGTGSLLGELACLGATTCYGCAFVYLRRFVLPLRLDPVTVALIQVGLAGVVLLVAAPFVSSDPIHVTWAVLGAMLALGVLGTGLAYVMNTNVVAGLGATAASTVTYLTPVVGVVLGVVVLGERISWNEPVGGLVVILGVALGQGLLRRGLTTSRPGGRAG
jgi:drug/metabolite transporter (DMT)-like permease